MRGKDLSTAFQPEKELKLKFITDFLRQNLERFHSSNNEVILSQSVSAMNNSEEKLTSIEITEY